MTLCSTLLVVEPFGRTRRGRVDRRGHWSSAANATRTNARASRSNFFSFRLDRDSVVDPLPRLHPRRRCVDVDGNINRCVHHSWLSQHELDNSSILLSCYSGSQIQYRTVLQVSRLELHARPSTRSYTTFLVRHLEIYNPSRSSGPTRTMTSALYL